MSEHRWKHGGVCAVCGLKTDRRPIGANGGKKQAYRLADGSWTAEMPSCPPAPLPARRAPEAAPAGEPVEIPRTIKVRDLVRLLERAGCRVDRRQKGSHQTWKTPSGARIGVVVNHPGDEAYPGRDPQGARGGGLARMKPKSNCGRPLGSTVAVEQMCGCVYRRNTGGSPLPSGRFGSGRVPGSNGRGAGTNQKGQTGE